MLMLPTNQPKVFLSVLDNHGNTPIVNMFLESNQNVNLYLKLEMYNPTGSVKDRAASYIIKKLLSEKVITQQTILIESSSGNFGVSLAAYSKLHNMKFICVVDPNITSRNEKMIKLYGGAIDKVLVPDAAGGYLLSRINRVMEYLQQYNDIYWINQYENILNSEAYKNSLGVEICQVDHIDYVFIGVSSCGTITGVSQKVKEQFPNSKIIAVDIDGSVIFGGTPKKRVIPGIGSSKIPKIIEQAIIDDVVYVNEEQTILMCHNLMHKYNLCCGGSSGSVFSAVNKYFEKMDLKKKVNVVAIMADRGECYLDQIYNTEWCRMLLGDKTKESPFAGDGVL